MVSLSYVILVVWCDALFLLPMDNRLNRLMIIMPMLNLFFIKIYDIFNVIVML